jgi:hypothetical protein
MQEKKNLAIKMDQTHYICMENTNIPIYNQKITEDKLNKLFDLLERDINIPTTLRQDIIPQILNGTDAKGFFNESKHEYFLHGSNCGIGTKLKIDSYSCWISNYWEWSDLEKDKRMIACNALIEELLKA